MKVSRGFTLIELVIVIVILGILAITAAPKFLNLSADARVSTLDAVQASLVSANAVVNSKAIIANKQTNSATTINTSSGVTTNIVYGYTKAAAADINTILDASDFTVIANPIASGTGVFIYPTELTLPDTPSTTNLCGLLYNESASSGAKPTYTIYSGGC